VNKIVANWTHLIIKNMTDFEVGVAEGFQLGKLSWSLQKRKDNDQAMRMDLKLSNVSI
jgi:hypothetical protein